MQQQLPTTEKKLLSALADDCLTVATELESEARLLNAEIRNPSEFREQRIQAAEQQMKTAAATVKDFLKELKEAQVQNLHAKLDESGQNDANSP